MKFTYTEDQTRLLKICGVPSGLVYPFSTKVKDHVRSHVENNQEEGKAPFSLSSSDQMSVLKALSNLSLAPPQKIVLSANEEITNLRRFMVPWFCNAAEYTKNNPAKTMGALPVWNYIDFSFNDRLMDILRGRDTEISFGQFKPLLVLDGVFTDSSPNKVEKLRDILNLSLDHCVVLLLGGENPYSFCKTRLGFAPKQFAVLASPRNRTVL